MRAIILPDERVNDFSVLAPFTELFELKGIVEQSGGTRYCCLTVAVIGRRSHNPEITSRAIQEILEEYIFAKETSRNGPIECIFDARHARDQIYEASHHHVLVTCIVTMDLNIY
ncbi:MAG: hypothetical protein AAB263_21610 [Planctomycetota bacterium]